MIRKNLTKCLRISITNRATIQLTALGQALVSAQDNPKG